MDFSDVVKQIEQFIYELFMWVIFYPLTLVRVVARPTNMLHYVRAQIAIDPDLAFDNAIRPPLFLFLSIAIGSLVAPIGAPQAAVLGETALGAWMLDSWINLLAFRMLSYSVFAVIGALLYDLITPGPVTRHTLRLPFYQQCYICAPFALILSPTLVRFDTGNEALPFVALALQLWLFGAETVFFRRMVGVGWFKALLLSLVVLVCGNGALVVGALIGMAVR